MVPLADLPEPADVQEEAGRIIIEPVRPKAYHPDELVHGIDPKNTPQEIDFGSAVGEEIW